MSSSIEFSTQVKYRSGLITTAGNLIPNLSLGRRCLIIQNLSTNPLYVYFGTGADTVTNYDLILKGGLASYDGNGGTFTEDTLSYQGVISVAGTGIICQAVTF